MILQSVPIMLALFLLFPRVQGPLWGLPQINYSAKSGLSESMAPGDVSSLSLSDDVDPKEREDWIDFMVDLARYERELFRLFDAPGPLTMVGDSITRAPSA